MVRTLTSSMLPTWFLYGKYYQFPVASYGNVLCEESTGEKKNHENVSATAQVDVRTIISPELYPVASQNALIRRNDLSSKYADLVSSIMGTSYITKETATSEPIVCAAGVLNENSATEIIDIDRLSQKSTSVIQYVEIMDAVGRLYCVDELISTSCWLKAITLAKDCHSCNVILTTHDKGMILKTTRSIKPGESLQMWFSDHILAMLNIKPFLAPINIQDKNRYVCHTCNAVFEYPNPLKIHLALNCGRLNTNLIWTILAKRFAAINASETTLFRSLYTRSTFELTSSTTLLINKLQPTLSDTMYTGVSRQNDSPSSSNRLSPLSLTRPSPSSSTTQIPSSPKQPSPNMSEQQVVPTENLQQTDSAFKPYVQPRNRIMSYSAHPSATFVTNNIYAADVETLVSNMGRSKDGHMCIYCGRIYTRKYGLKIHIRTHTGYKPLKCQFCNRAFGDPSNLNKHVRLHANGDTPYKCDMCGKVLVRRRDLERHIKSRHRQGESEDISETSSDANDVLETERT